MYESVALSLVVLLGLVPVAITVWWGLLRLMDKVAGLDFRDAIDLIEESPQACAIYFGFRAFAAAYLVEGLFTRFV